MGRDPRDSYLNSDFPTDCLGMIFGCRHWKVNLALLGHSQSWAAPSAAVLLSAVQQLWGGAEMIYIAYSLAEKG